LLIVPDLHWQEAGDQAVHLALGLRARQCAVHILTGPLPFADDDTLAQAGVAVTSLEARTARNPQVLYQAWQTLRAFRPEVVHTFQAGGNRLARLLAGLLTRAPIFSSGHVSADDSTPWRRRLRTLGQQRGGKWLVASEALATVWSQTGVPRERIAVLSPGIAPPVQRHADAALRSRLSLRPAVPTIVCAGALLRRHGFFDAVWALDVLRQTGQEAQLLIAGSGPERPRIVQFSRALEIDDAVSFLGSAVALQDIWELADAVWFPSQGEDTPHLLLQAMAAGRPVIAAQTPGLAEFVSDGQTGLLVPQGEQVLLARQTLRLLGDASLRATLGQSAREHVHLHRGLDAWVDKQVDLYRESLASVTK
jgi:glycosyltransferase involved in cell wall biosynthesis